MSLCEWRCIKRLHIPYFLSKKLQLTGYIERTESFATNSTLFCPMRVHLGTSGKWAVVLCTNSRRTCSSPRWNGAMAGMYCFHSATPVLLSRPNSCKKTNNTSKGLTTVDSQKQNCQNSLTFYNLNKHAGFKDFKSIEEQSREHKTRSLSEEHHKYWQLL